MTWEQRVYVVLAAGLAAPLFLFVGSIGRQVYFYLTSKKARPGLTNFAFEPLLGAAMCFAMPFSNIAGAGVRWFSFWINLGLLVGAAGLVIEIDEFKLGPPEPGQSLARFFKQLPRGFLVFAPSLATFYLGQKIGEPLGRDVPFEGAPTLLGVICGGFAVGILWMVWLRVAMPVSSRVRFSATGVLGGLEEAATRGKSIVVGAWASFLGACLLWFVWRMPFGEYLSGPAHNGVLLVGSGIGLYVLFRLGLGPIVQALSFSSLSDNTHGQARTATRAELDRAGLIPRQPEAIYLGQFLDNGRRLGTVGYPGGVHLITVGATGSGKGTGLIIPNLSTLRRSIIIIDPKGEAAAITARKRAKFGRVVMLNPFNLLAKDRPWMRSEGFNPLSAVRTDENFLDDCTIIGQSLIKQEVSGNGRFFSGSAHDLITALVMHEVLTKSPRGEIPTLASVREKLTEPFEINRDTGLPTGLAETILDMTQSSYEPLRAKAGRFKTASNSNRDVISTAINETSFIDSPPVGNDLASKSDFRFAGMKEEIVTVYLVLPATHLESHSNWLRLIIASALRELLATPANPAKPPVLFMLDEFAQLSHLPAISNAMNIARSFGVQLWPFVQDVNQLRSIYRDNWENFLGASAALTAFAPRDLFTSDYLSKLCGNKTIIVESENERSGASGIGRGRGPQSSPLFRPEEMRGMAPGQMLCFVDPVKNPFMAQAPGYWESDFKVGLDANPYHRG